MTRMMKLPLPLEVYDREKKLGFAMSCMLAKVLREPTFVPEATK